MKNPARAILVLLALASGGTAQEPGAPFDAEFVRMEIPKKVLTDEVFPAKIVLKNTGTRAWREDQGTHTRLRSQDPEDNLTWGTSYIIQGQGVNVEPGAEWAFTSNLKAPATPGPHVFRWRLARATGDSAFFGKPTAAETLEVEKRTGPPTAPPIPPRPGRKQVLGPDDFEYVGSFGVPRAVQGAGADWSESGLALRRTKEGEKRLFLNYTHPTQALFEASIPEPARLEAGGPAALPVAEVRKAWGPVEIRIPRSGDTDRLRPNGGFWWEEASRTLYWTSYHGYRAGDMLPVLGLSKLGEDGRIVSSGPWSIPDPVSGRYKSYWGGVTRLPRDFAARYTKGRTLALGFGGYYSICGPCSRGPALGAIAEPDPAAKTVDLVEMLTYAGGARAPRDGDYFSANCGFWNEPPEGPSKGTWTFDDMARSGIFVDSPRKHGFIVFVRLGTGRLGYDYGAITSAGKAQAWYCYDPEDLGEAALGSRPPGEIRPRSTSRFAGPGENAGANAQVTGSCFDEETGRLYLFKPFALKFGVNDVRPAVHVYRLKP
jgi:hypothetical protein